MEQPKLIPGRFININNTVYRIKRRICGCNGCSLNSFDRCPNISDSRNGHPLLECNLNNVMFVKT